MDRSAINEKQRKHYAEDPEYREKQIRASRAYRAVRGKEIEQHRRESRRTEKRDYMRGYHLRPEVRVRYNQRRKHPMVRIYRNLDKLARRRAGKLCSVFSILLGCSRAELIVHIEKQFRPGMCWGNYGKWEVDHIRPYASFDLSDPAQQWTCFHYTNLQPLWAEENVAKGAT